MCIHCGEEGDKKPSRKSHHSPRAGAEQPSAVVRQIAGVLRGNAHHGDMNEIK